jgi:fumarate hydratase class II
MPGKVNPVMAEAVLQMSALVIGADLTITLCGQAGNFELNVMMPLMAHQLLESIRIMAGAIRAFTDRCVRGIEAEEERCRASIEQSLAMCTSLAPVIGYDAAAAIAKEAYATGRTVREVARERTLLSEEQLARILDPWRMTEPGVP